MATGGKHLWRIFLESCEDLARAWRGFNSNTARYTFTAEEEQEEEVEKGEQEESLAGQRLRQQTK